MGVRVPPVERQCFTQRFSGSVCPRGGVFRCTRHHDVTVAVLPGEFLPRCGECHRADGAKKFEQPLGEPEQTPAHAAPTVWDMVCDGDGGQRHNGASHAADLQTAVRR